MSKRDSAYFIYRLRREAPGIYADLDKGLYPSVRAAALAAGIVKERSRLTELKNAWNKATNDERRAFVAWAKAQLKATKAAPPRSVIGSDRRLLPWALQRLDEIETAQKLKPGQIMRQMGFDPRNQSLQNARHHGNRIRPELAEALAEWLGPY